MNKATTKSGLTIDNVPLTATIDEPSKTYIRNGEKATFSINISKSVILDSSKITVTGTGSTGCIIEVTGSGTTYTVTVTGGTGNGAVTLNVATGAFTDNAGNTSVATSKTGLTIDNTEPKEFSITAYDLEPDHSLEVNGETTDEHSGISGYMYSMDNGSTWTELITSPSYVFEGVGIGTYYIKMKAIDNAGNIRETDTLTITTNHMFSDYEMQDNSTHSRTCYICSYTETGSHTLGSWTSLDINSHIRTCTSIGCGYYETASHYKVYGKNNEVYHNLTCGTCDLSVLQGHNFRTVTQRVPVVSNGVIVDYVDLTFRECTLCKYSDDFSISGGSGDNTGTVEGDTGGGMDNICEIRGYHSNCTYTNMNSEQHKGVCGICGYHWYESHNLVGYSTYFKCSKCGYTIPKGNPR